jgi:hypothetical protein
MGLRVEDGGRSEGRSVMGRIGVESPASDREHYQVTTSPHAKAGRLPIQVARHEMVWRTVVGGKANDGGHGPSWCALQRNECKTAPSVYREVVTGGLNCHSGSYQGAFERLERLDAKGHEPFLGGWGPAMAPGYPTGEKI